MFAARQITYDIDREMDDELELLAFATGRDKASLAREALIEWLEDQEDIRAARAVIAEGNPSYSIEEVRRHLCLDG